MVCFKKPDWNPAEPNAKSIIEDLPFQWVDKVKSMERPASTSLEPYLLDGDDPRIHQARLDLSKRAHLAADEKARAPSEFGSLSFVSIFPPSLFLSLVAFSCFDST